MKFTSASGYRSSPMEKKIEKALSERGIPFYREVMFNGCINPLTGMSLRYDFYIQSMNLLIEYDGKAFHTDIDVKLRDQIKDRFAVDNSIRMVRISGGAINLLISKYLNGYDIIEGNKSTVRKSKKTKLSSKERYKQKRIKEQRERWKRSLEPTKPREVSSWKQIKKLRDR